MKSTFSRLITAVLACLLICLSTFAQETKVREKNVPAAVVRAFKSAYPQAQIRGYAKEKEHGKVFYEVESMDGTTHRDILYNPDGTVAEIEERIAATDLPAEAQQTIHQKYPRATITIAEKITIGDKIGYEVSAKQGKRRISLEFDADGKLVKPNSK